MLKGAKNTSKFFKCVGTANHEDGMQASYGKSIYQVLNEEEYEAVSAHFLFSVTLGSIY